MQTPTLDHTDHTDRPARGSCPCRPWRLCPTCAGKLQRFRHESELQRFVIEFGAEPSPSVRARPRLRLVK